MATTTEYDQIEMGSPRKHDAPEGSAPGDFYVIDDCCITCGVPLELAPDLIGWLQHGNHCYWKKQPATPAEFRQAVAVFGGSELGCHRYAGSDPEMIVSVGRENCDYPEFAGPAPPGDEGTRPDISIFWGLAKAFLADVWKLRKR